jgi:hypothetical protein
MLQCAKVVAVFVAILGVCLISSIPGPAGGAWVRSTGQNPGRVRILRFSANVGAIMPGQKALLCYGVENARSVRISPAMIRVSPSANRCMEIFPQHTTHYTLLAEGYDGSVASQSLTLPVQIPFVIPQLLQFATLLI